MSYFRRSPEWAYSVVIPPLCVKLQISHMVPLPTNTGVSPASENSTEKANRPGDAPAPEVFGEDPQRLLQEYTKLRDRLPAHHQRSDFRSARPEDSAGDSERLRRIAAQREVRRIERSAARSAPRHALQRARLQSFIQDFLTFSVLETGELQAALRARRHERLSLGDLPPVVAALSGQRAGTLLPGQR